MDVNKQYSISSILLIIAGVLLFAGIVNLVTIIYMRLAIIDFCIAFILLLPGIYLRTKSKKNHDINMKTKLSDFKSSFKNVFKNEFANSSKGRTILNAFIQTVLPTIVVYSLVLADAIAALFLVGALSYILILPLGVLVFIFVFGAFGIMGFAHGSKNTQYIEIDGKIVKISKPGQNGGAGVAFLLSMFCFVFCVPISIVFFIFSTVKISASEEYCKQVNSYKNNSYLRFMLAFIVSSTLLLVGFGISFININILMFGESFENIWQIFTARFNEVMNVIANFFSY